MVGSFGDMAYQVFMVTKKKGGGGQWRDNSYMYIMQFLKYAIAIKYK